MFKYRDLIGHCAVTVKIDYCIDKQSFHLRNYLLRRKKEIVEIINKQNDKDEPIELKTLRKLYDDVQNELISIEEDCNKFWVEMKLDLLLENKSKSEPLSDKFSKNINGELIKNEGWSTVLDINGNQLRSKWYFVVSPQIEKLLKKRRIYSLHLDPLRVYNFLLSIPKCGIHFELSKKDLFSLLQNVDEEGPWLTSWKPQLKTVDKEKIAAILIQSCWRGYLLRKQLKESYRLYIAASVLWYKWLSIRNKRKVQTTYLEKMLSSLKVVRKLNEKFMDEFNDLIRQPHVIIHLPSIGYPVDIRRTFTPQMLAIYQHTMSLRLSFLRNPMSEMIYILPIEVTQDFLSMYVDIIDSVISQERTGNRITFLPLSQAKTLERTHMNVSRILHCSEDTLVAIRNKINGKSAYILPWIIDECDVRISDNLGVPLLGPDMLLQQKLLNLSRMCEIIDDLGLPQPAHSKDIREYSTLCSKLAELILLNTDICLWLIKVNFGLQTKHCGIFLINHISIPFMPAIRETRKRYGNEWLTNSHVREDYLNALLIHLTKVLSIVTYFNDVYYRSWKDFYDHVQKFGCLLQAVPKEKKSSIITLSYFVPNKNTMKPVKLIGTSNKIPLDVSFSSFAYMLPQTSINIEILNPSVNKVAYKLQQLGYFGYLTVDCYCYFDNHDENMNVLLLDVNPYYSHLQQYIDWMKFVIDGGYNSTTDTFNANVVTQQYYKKRITNTSINDTEWDEITERTAIIICDLYHENLPNYTWAKLKILMEDIGTCNILKKLSQALSTKRKSKTNMSNIVEFFEKFALNYHDLSRDPCK
ncbi:PREDICTED: IQ motif-containing protein H-like [Polistes dominula]|uniref:IQ motif-containing protein H-like n=1 Tax=Polistes dominula TaxID=743375 RepID=A0ABM1HU04_POLDO|nr:PREDICTED: IQ motif-containing protein H-like [Polistes dominula]